VIPTTPPTLAGFHRKSRKGDLRSELCAGCPAPCRLPSSRLAPSPLPEASYEDRVVLQKRGPNKQLPIFGSCSSQSKQQQQQLLFELPSLIEGIKRLLSESHFLVAIRNQSSPSRAAIRNRSCFSFNITRRAAIGGRNVAAINLAWRWRQPWYPAVLRGYDQLPSAADCQIDGQTIRGRPRQILPRYGGEFVLLFLFSFR
jgi:hypothetical protein